MGKEKFREPIKTEKIACVNKLLGGKYCEVFLSTEKNKYETLQCRIPGKFSKNKKKNLLTFGGFVLVDFHDYLTNTKSCEIVEIYGDCYRNHIEITYRALVNAYNEHYEGKKTQHNDIIQFTNEDYEELNPQVMKQKIPQISEDIDDNFFDGI